jgi:hypothetical protein
MIRSLFGWMRPFLAIGIGAILLASPAVAFFARFGNGPIGPFPGGPLLGEIEARPEQGWAFAADLETIEVEINADPPRSIRTGVIVHGGALYLPATLTPFKRWHLVAFDDPRVVVRIEGRMYDLHAAPIVEPDWHEVLMSAGRRKYGGPMYAEWASDATQFFRLDPPRPY